MPTCQACRLIPGFLVDGKAGRLLYQYSIAGTPTCAFSSSLPLYFFLLPFLSPILAIAVFVYHRRHVLTVFYIQLKSTPPSRPQKHSSHPSQYPNGSSQEYDWHTMKPTSKMCILRAVARHANGGKHLSLARPLSGQAFTRALIS